MSWNEIWFIASRDLRQLLRGREALLWLFIMPIVFFYFIGTVTADIGGGAPSGPVRLALWAPADAGFLVERVVARLEDNGFEVVRPASEVELGTHKRRLLLPAGFTASALAGDKVVFELSGSNSGLTQQYDELRVRKAVYTVLADLAAATELAGGEPTPEALAELDALPRTLGLDVSTAGARPEPPGGFEQAIPGILIMFTLLVLLTSGAASLVIERNQGLLERLASTPLSRGSIVAGKWLSRVLLGAVQIGFALGAGTLLFKMKWGPDLPMILLVLAGWGALCASLGLLLAGLARTQGQAVGIGVLTSNVLAALGGCWWPIEITPAWMQALQKLLPTGWAMDALHRLVSFQAGASSALPHVAALFTAALFVGWLAVRRFEFKTG